MKATNGNEISANTIRVVSITCMSQHVEVLLRKRDPA